MKVEIEKNQEDETMIKWNLLNLDVVELSKIQIALMDYYTKLKDLKKISDSEIVKEMLSKFDINV